jgi:hypothetical protein
MKGNGKHISLPNRNGMPIDLRENVDILTEFLHPRRANEDRMDGLAVEVEVCLE